MFIFALFNSNHTAILQMQPGYVPESDRRGCFAGWAAFGLLLAAGTITMIIVAVIGDYAGTLLAGWQGLSFAATALVIAIRLGYSAYDTMGSVNVMMICFAVGGAGLAAAELVLLAFWLNDCPSTDLKPSDICPGEDCTQMNLACLDGGYWHIFTACIIAATWVCVNVAYVIIGFGYCSEASRVKRQSKSNKQRRNSVVRNSTPANPSVPISTTNPDPATTPQLASNRRFAGGKFRGSFV